MVTRGRRVRAAEKSYRNWTILLVGFLVLIGLGIGAYLSFGPKPLDAATLCPGDGPRGHIVLLIDKTDVPGPIQKAALEQSITALVERGVPEGYLLSLFALDEDFQKTAEPLVEVCNPGDGSGKSELTTTVSRLKKKYKDKFLTPVLAVSNGMVAKEPAKWSPIFEMLQLVGINSFKRHNVSGERRLVIVSDMLHNTPQFSMYQSAANFEQLEAADYGRRTLADLAGVDVELIYIITAPKLQTRGNLLFWEKYFAKAGARIRKVTPLEG